MCKILSGSPWRPSGCLAARLSSMGSAPAGHSGEAERPVALRDQDPPSTVVVARTMTASEPRHGQHVQPIPQQAQHRDHREAQQLQDYEVQLACRGLQGKMQMAMGWEPQHRRTRPHSSHRMSDQLASPSTK